MCGFLTLGIVCKTSKWRLKYGRGWHQTTNSISKQRTTSRWKKKKRKRKIAHESQSLRVQRSVHRSASLETHGVHTQSSISLWTHTTTAPEKVVMWRLFISLNIWHNGIMREMIVAPNLPRSYWYTQLVPASPSAQHRELLLHVTFVSQLART